MTAIGFFGGTRSLDCDSYDLHTCYGDWTFTKEPMTHQMS